MKKKGTTESYSAFIGLVIAFLMLTAIGCAVYNIYKPKGINSFNNLVNQIRKLENKGDGEGELTLFLEKDQFIVGFNKNQEAFDYSPDCPSNIVEGLIEWGCYGVQFLKPEEAGNWITSLSRWISQRLKTPMKILKPKKCAADKTCLCLCKMDRLDDPPHRISEKTCMEQTAVCASFDVIEFMGGEGCCEGLFIPGTQGSVGEERGLKVVSYKKVGNKLSLSDIQFKGELDKILEGEKQKTAQLQAYLKTKRSIYFMPVNWDKGAQEFERAVSAHYDYTEKKIKDLEEKSGQEFINSLSESFNMVSFKDYTQCSGIELINTKIEGVREKVKNCLMKADNKITEDTFKDSKAIGMTDDQGICGRTDTVDFIISRYDDPVMTAHEWGHLMLFCDEYKYSEWKDANDDLLKKDFECRNPYPICCKDHPYWTDDLEGYKAYLEKEKIGRNCYPHYQDLSDKAKKRFKTKEEYDTYINEYSLCQGHVCKPENPNYKYCRGIMGPEISCENKDLVYDNSLDYSFLDYDYQEDFEAREALSKNGLEKQLEEEKKTEEEKGEAEVILSASCGEENEFVIDQLVPVMWDWDFPVTVLNSKTEEDTCLMPQTLAEKVNYEYESAESFLQIEYDESITEDDIVVIAYQEDASQSLSHELVNELQDGFEKTDFQVTLIQSKDPVINKIEKPAVEIKVSKDNYKVIDPILVALRNYKQKKELREEEEIKEKTEFLKTLSWQWPVSEPPRVTSCFGPRQGGEHGGIDIGPITRGRMGDPIYAVFEGTVRKVIQNCPDTSSQGCGGGYGNYVVIDHGEGHTAIYAHLTKNIMVKEGDKVTKGQVIGGMGNSGHSEAVHLHFGVYDTAENPTASGNEGSLHPWCFLDTMIAKGKPCFTESCPYKA